MKQTIDINCDLGEGAENDAQLMPYITSANIACGAHAGDTSTMQRTVALAIQHHVSIGAHPGYADRANFGRIEIKLSPAEIIQLVTRQIRDLQQICQEQGTKIVHVKPHGALYNVAVKDDSIAQAIAYAVHGVSKDYILVGLAGSLILKAGKQMGLPVFSEAFADRTYQPDGSLTPRTHPKALIHDPMEACRQVECLIKNKWIVAIDGTPIPMIADTVCIHGDGPNAPGIVKALSDRLGRQPS